MTNCYCLELTVISSLPVPVSQRPPLLSILFVKINTKAGAGLEMAVQVNNALIAPATFICRWYNKDGTKGKTLRPDFATDVCPSDGHIFASQIVLQGFVAGVYKLWFVTVFLCSGIRKSLCYVSFSRGTKSSNGRV